MICFKGSTAQDEDEKPEITSNAGDAIPTSSRNGPRLSRSKEDEKDFKAMQKLLYSLLDTISSHRDGSVFQNPVKRVTAIYFQAIMSSSV